MGVSAATEVDHQHIDGPRPDQGIGDLERLLAGVRLRDEEVVDLDAELPGVDWIERMFGVDEGRDAAFFLCLGNDLKGERGLSRQFRTINLDNAAAGQAADAESDIQA